MARCKRFAKSSGFEQFLAVNVVVGRNNSGKSTLVDLLEVVTAGDRKLAQLPSCGPESVEVWVDVRFPDDSSVVAMPVRGPNNEDFQHWLRKQHPLGVHIRVEDGSSQITFEGGNVRDSNAYLNLLRHGFGGGQPFEKYSVRRVAADRDLRPEENPFGGLHPDGRGATGLMRHYLTKRGADRSIVERRMLDALNEVFEPETSFRRIAIDESETGQWEVQLDDHDRERVPLGDTGSGLRTVLLVLLNLIAIPDFQQRLPCQYLFAFEELENNLHPAVQRRLVRYVREFAVRNSCVVVLTTHSSVIIDQFAGDPEAQILQVRSGEGRSTVHRVDSATHHKVALDDLGVRTSDLLQSNAIVWVEGPSDRLYFNRWIEIFTGGSIREREHYVCLPYGGAILSHFTFDEDPIEDFIAALKVNRNAVVIMDRDGGPDLKSRVARVQKELAEGDGIAWITKGREVENYIPVDALRCVFEIGGLRGAVEGQSVFEYLKRAAKRSPKKIELAHAVVPHLTEATLCETFDLVERIREVVDRLANWNGLEEVP